MLHPFPNVTANTDLVGTVADVISPSSGKTPIPPDGAVLQARGSGAFRLVGDAPLGSTVTIRYTLNPTWEGIVGAIGGGPVLVKDGKPVFRANESFTTSQLAPHDPRTAVGQRADGKIIMVAVDGRQPGYSAGVTSFELALAMMQLGCVSASGLDAGGSTTMAFDGRLLNRPSDRGGERSVAEALLVSYTGVYVPPAPEPVLSPNGDGVAEAESLSYKIVRPSTVQASLDRDLVALSCRSTLERARRVRTDSPGRETDNPKGAGGSRSPRPTTSRRPLRRSGRSRSTKHSRRSP